MLVLGGRYADGFDRRGLISSLIVGCTDTQTYNSLGKEGPPVPPKFMALTKVNFNRNVENILEKFTGFKRADQYGEMQLGKWFESDDVPEFISSESYQRGPENDDGGWKPKKIDVSCSCELCVQHM